MREPSIKFINGDLRKNQVELELLKYLHDVPAFQDITAKYIQYAWRYNYNNKNMCIMCRCIKYIKKFIYSHNNAFSFLIHCYCYYYLYYYNYGFTIIKKKLDAKTNG